MSLPDETLSIETPENVAFGYQIAGIGSRFLAALVDTLLILVLQLVVNGTLLLLAQAAANNIFQDSALRGWLVAAGGLISFAFLWGYYIFFELAWNGQTPGKRWAGLRVIRTSGAPITLAESIIRNLVRIIDLLPSFYGVGIITMFIDERSRRLGDLAAGTLVVRDRGPISLESLEQSTQPAKPLLHGSTGAGPALPVERLAPTDLQLAQDFVLRRDELFNRVELSQRIAQSLFERMGLSGTAPQWPESERFILDVVRAAQSHPGV